MSSSRSSRGRFRRSISDSRLTSGGAGRPGTGYSCSPETRSGIRVVTSAFRFGQRRRSSATSGPASVTCSKLSSTSRTRPAPTSSASTSIDGFVAFSASPTVRAIVGVTNAGSRTASRATNQTPSGKSSAAVAATWSERRVFPVPPGPVSDSSRVPRSSSPASASSRSRPTNVVSWVGRLFGRASSDRKGGKVSGRPSIAS